MKYGRLQCKDIPTLPILEMLALNPEKWHTWDEGYGYMPTVRDAMPEGTPRLLQHAKMKHLFKKV